MNLAHLPLKVSRRDPFAEQFQATHLGFDQAAPEVATPALLDAASQTMRHPQGFVTGVRPCGVLFPGLAVLAHGNDHHCVARCDAGMARLRVIGPVAADRGDGLGLGNLRQQVRQHGRIADAIAGDAYRPDFQGFRVNAQMHLAPLQTVLRSMFPGLPFAFADHLDAGAVDQQMQSILARAIGDLDGQHFLPTAQRAVVRNRPVQSRQGQQIADQACALPQELTVQRLDHLAELNGGVRECGIAPPFAVACHIEPRYLRIKPRHQRAASLECRVVALPVGRSVFRGGGGRHLGCGKSFNKQSRQHVSCRRLCNKAMFILKLEIKAAKPGECFLLGILTRLSLVDRNGLGRIGMIKRGITPKIDAIQTKEMHTITTVDQSD